MAGWGAPPVAAVVPQHDADLRLPLPPGTDTISAVGFHPAGNFVAYSSWDGKLGVYELNRGANGMVVSATPKILSVDTGGPVLDFKWTADGNSICAVGCNRKAMLWNLQSNTFADLGTHDAPIKSVNFCPTLNAFATGGWDSTLRYFDARAPREVARVPLPAKVHAADVKDDCLVLGTADKKFHIINLASPTIPLKSVDSPLKLNTRCIRICHDKQFYLAASPEGRCAIRCVDSNNDTVKIPGSNPEKTYAFAFKCHRENTLIYPVNALDAHPLPEFHSVFATAGGDGSIVTWDREKRQRVRDMKVTLQAPVPAPPGGNTAGGSNTPVTDCRWSPRGELMAYALGYDWSKGGEHFDPGRMPPSLWIHSVNPDSDLRAKK